MEGRDLCVVSIDVSTDLQVFEAWENLCGLFICFNFSASEIVKATVFKGLYEIWVQVTFHDRNGRGPFLLYLSRLSGSMECTGILYLFWGLGDGGADDELVGIWVQASGTGFLAGSPCCFMRNSSAHCLAVLCMRRGVATEGFWWGGFTIGNGGSLSRWWFSDTMAQCWKFIWEQFRFTETV
jgi:hypothetical protein